MKQPTIRILALATLLCGVALRGGSPVHAQEEATEPPPAEASSGGASEAAGAEARASSEYNRELLSIEEQVHSLKEQVFRSKATLQLLKEIVVQGSSVGSRATIWHVNKLGRGYTLESVAYYLDGQGKFSKADPAGGLDDMREFKVFEGAVPPGNHNLTVNLKLRGSGFGIFSYVKNYTFNVQSSTAFAAEEGKSCSVKVITDERGGIGKSFTERPNVTFETQCIRLADTGAQ